MIQWVLWFIFLSGDGTLYSAPLHPFQTKESCEIRKAEVRVDMEHSYPKDKAVMWFLCLKHSEGPPKGSK